MTTQPQQAPSGLVRVDRNTDPAWLATALEALEFAGCAVVEGALAPEAVTALRAALYEVQPRLVAEVGEERLERAGERGVLRLPMRHAPALLELLAHPDVLALVDATVGETAIMHLMNGFILPPIPAGSELAIFQTTFHRDFPRVLNGYLASVNVFLALDDFSASNGATRVVPGTHQHERFPSAAYCKRAELPVTCPAGSLIAFDSTLVHAAGLNTSGRDRLAINMQFTRSYLKQQIDYVRALGDEVVTALPPRTQQLLGYYTRVVTSVDEYYRPEAERLYRRGQG